MSRGWPCSSGSGTLGNSGSAISGNSGSGRSDSSGIAGSSGSGIAESSVSGANFLGSNVPTSPPALTSASACSGIATKVSSAAAIIATVIVIAFIILHNSPIFRYI